MPAIDSPLSSQAKVLCTAWRELSKAEKVCVFVVEAPLILCSRLLMDRVKTAISASRPKAWITQKSRRHDPVQIYMGKADYSEILVQGKIKSWFKTGEVVEAEFIAGISFEFENGQQEAKCWRYRVWGVRLLSSLPCAGARVHLRLKPPSHHQ